MRTIAMIRMVLSGAVLGIALASTPARASAQGGCSSETSYAKSLRQMSTSPQCDGWLPGTAIDATRGLLVLKYTVCSGGTLLAIVRGESYVTLPVASAGRPCVDANQVARSNAYSVSELTSGSGGRPFAAHLWFAIEAGAESRCERACPPPPSDAELRAEVEKRVQRFVGETGELWPFPPSLPSPSATARWSFEAKNQPRSYLRFANSLAGIGSVTNGLEAQYATFQLVPGLLGRCASFAAVNMPNYYLRHSGFRLRLDHRDNSQLFDEDATFCVVQGLSGDGISFQSVNYPNRFLRHKNWEMWLDERENTSHYNEDATFYQRAPLAMGR